jgi:formyltetrahydrofolate synthetase
MRIECGKFVIVPNQHIISSFGIVCMPGLPEEPASERIDIDSDGNITGLF